MSDKRPRLRGLTFLYFRNLKQELSASIQSRLQIGNMLDFLHTDLTNYILVTVHEGGLPTYDPVQTVSYNMLAIAGGANDDGYFISNNSATENPWNIKSSLVTFSGSAIMEYKIRFRYDAQYGIPNQASQRASRSSVLKSSNLPIVQYAPDTPIDRTFPTLAAAETFISNGIICEALKVLNGDYWQYKFKICGSAHLNHWPEGSRVLVLEDVFGMDMPSTFIRWDIEPTSLSIPIDYRTLASGSPTLSLATDISYSFAVMKAELNGLQSRMTSAIRRAFEAISENRNELQQYKDKIDKIIQKNEELNRELDALGEDSDFDKAVDAARILLVTISAIAAVTGQVAVDLMVAVAETILELLVQLHNRFA